MDTLKLFGKLLIAFLAFFIISTILSNLYVESTHKDISVALSEQVPKIKIEEAKATYVGGTIKGEVINSGNRRIRRKICKDRSIFTKKYKYWNRIYKNISDRTT